MLKLGLSSLKDPVLIDTVIQMFAVKSVHYADNIHAVWGYFCTLVELVLESPKTLLIRLEQFFSVCKTVV